MANFFPMLAQAGLSGLSALLGMDSQGVGPDVQRKTQLLEQLLASINGEGPYSDLFNMDEEAFQRSYVEPAKQRFRDITAPTIQQSFIAQGQQRGTGLEDTLSRAGIDMDQLLNQQFADMQQRSQQNKLGAINTILGTDTGAPAPGPSAAQSFFQGVGGGIGTESFGNAIGGLLGGNRNISVGLGGTRNRPAQASTTTRVRKGFQ